MRAGVHSLAALPGVVLAGVSRLYLTRPVGVTDQPDFHNAAVALDVPARTDPSTAALALLLALKGIEKAFGRQRRERWGPRELDLDLLLFGSHRIHVERPAQARGGDPEKNDHRWLDVPHPSARERLFVLAPLADLAPALEPPGWGESVESARRRRVSEEGADAVCVVAEWDDRADEWAVDRP